MSCFFYPVLIYILNRRTTDGFLEKAAEILLVHPDQVCQIPDIDFFLIIVLDISDGLFDGLDPPVIVPTGFCKHSIGRQYRQDTQKGRFDSQLTGNILCHGLPVANPLSCT